MGTLQTAQEGAVRIIRRAQVRDRNRTHRAALLHQIQQKLYDEVRVLPIWEQGVLNASGPRVAVSGVGLIPLFLFSGPYEDVQVKL
jgi:hypothetical protein